MQTPILLRLAFHDAGTYNAADGTGGPNASVQFELARVHNRASVRRFGWPLILRVRPCQYCCSLMFRVFFTVRALLRSAYKPYEDA